MAEAALEGLRAVHCLETRSQRLQKDAPSRSHSTRLRRKLGIFGQVEGKELFKDQPGQVVVNGPMGVDKFKERATLSTCASSASSQPSTHAEMTLGRHLLPYLCKLSVVLEETMWISEDT